MFYVFDNGSRVSVADPARGTILSIKPEGCIRKLHEFAIHERNPKWGESYLESGRDAGICLGSISTICLINEEDFAKIHESIKNMSFRVRELLDEAIAKGVGR